MRPKIIRIEIDPKVPRPGSSSFDELLHDPVMKTLIASLVIFSLVGGAFAQTGHDMSKMKKGMKMPVQAKGVQKATIVVDNDFKPGTINVKAGQPVQLTFDTRHKSCISSVSFAGMNLKKDLTDGKKTIFTFTPKKAGTYAFSCPMNMKKGKVVAK